jgi:hypothetical protein
MVFDAFGVHLRNALGDAKAAKKINNGLVPAFAGDSERAPFFSEKDRPVRLGSDQARSLQTRDGAINGHVGDSQAFGQVHDTGLPKFRNKIRDSFDIILGDLIGVFAAGLSEVLSLAFAANT